MLLLICRQLVSPDAPDSYWWTLLMYVEKGKKIPLNLRKITQVHIFYLCDPLPFFFIILVLNSSLLICFRHPYLQGYKNVWSSSSLQMFPWEWGWGSGGNPTLLYFLPRIATLKRRGPKQSSLRQNWQHCVLFGIVSLLIGLFVFTASCDKDLEIKDSFREITGRTCTQYYRI